MFLEIAVEKLVEPFEGHAPAGEDLRADVTPQSLYSTLRDARSVARAAERLAENDPAAGPAPLDDWKIVERLATEALSSRSKDIEIACWLIESLTRLRGLEGFADGTDVIRMLIASFWDRGLMPTMEEDDPEGRLIAISGLSGQDRDGSLLPPLRGTVLFEHGGGGQVTFAQYERSREVAALGTTKQVQAAIVPFADLEAGIRIGGDAALAALGQAAARALAAWLALEGVCAEVASGEAVPATARVRNVLKSIVKVVARYTSPQDETPDAAVETAVSRGGTTANDGGAATRTSPAARDAMLDEVLRIARVFRTTEPGSPLSYTLEEAVRRARLSWPDLLREVLPELPPRAGVLSVLGIKPPAD